MKQPFYLLTFLLLSILLGGCQSKEEKHWETELKKAEAIGTSEAYVDFLSRVPFHKPQYESVTSAISALNDLANNSLIDSCHPNTLLVDPAGLDEVIDLIISDKQTIPINLVISENEADKHLPLLKIDYGVKHISATYSPRGSANSYNRKTLSSGAVLNGTIKIDSGIPVTFERTIEPLDTMNNTSDEGAKNWSHRASFKLSNLKSAFAKTVMANCSPAAVTATYFDYTRFSPRIYPPMNEIWFKADSDLDKYVIEHLDETLPIMYMAFYSSYSGVAARDHVVVLISNMEPEAGVKYLRALFHIPLHSSSIYDERDIIEALHKIGTPQAKAVLAEYRLVKNQ